MINGFALILAPGFAARVFEAIIAPVFIGEASFCFWLLVKGVNLDRWRVQAEAQL
jgi:hypothetical protein